MPRSESPNGKVEFCYDFPLASTSQLAPTKPKRQRTRSPTRAQTNYYLSDDDEENIVYPESSLTHTGNQWTQYQRPPSPLYPYGAFYDAYDSFEYSHPSPLLLTPPARSCDSACSMLSACSSLLQQQQSQRSTKKIRKPRRSVDSDAPVPPLSSSPYSTSPLSPNSFLDDSDELELESSHSHSEYPYPSYTFSPEFEEPEAFGDDEEIEEGQEEPHGPAPSALKKQWAALSLKVRFGVFRAKRRMRARVMSL